jgi:hypothetical protein
LPADVWDVAGVDKIGPIGQGHCRTPARACATPGYVQDEFFVGGTATTFTTDKVPDNRFSTVTPGKTAPYRTRVIVRRPLAAAFSGTGVVEWFNVSAVEEQTVAMGQFQPPPYVE